jgi:hypothetical protein
MHVSSTTKNFHFQELNWIISFPQHGNQGKYVNYTVTLKKGAEAARKQRLGDVLESRDFEQNYPYTARYYKSTPEKAFDCPRDLLEIRGIKCIEEFWAFLNSLDI